VVGAVFSVIVLRLVLLIFMYKSTVRFLFFAQFARLIATGFAAFTNACMIEISGWIFQIIARTITNWEHPRTQADYENSYTFKMFLFQFINYYSSLIYTAFFKVH
jgi:anoctamin-4